MKKVFLFLTTLISLSALTIDGSAQIDRGELGSLTTVKDGLRSRRISSADKTGNNGDCVGQFKPGEKWSVEIPGTGVINHIWFTIAPTSIMRNDLIFRIYWDGNKYPSVEAPIAAFFGNIKSKICQKFPFLFRRKCMFFRCRQRHIIDKRRILCGSRKWYDIRKIRAFCADHAGKIAGIISGLFISDCYFKTAFSLFQ